MSPRCRPGRLIHVVVVACAVSCACGGSNTKQPAPTNAPTKRTTKADAGVIPERLGPFDGKAIMADVNWMCAEPRAGRGSFQKGGVETADYFATEFGKLGLKVVRQKLASPSSSTSVAQNVIAIYRGDDKAVIVSSHYDHLGISGGVVYPGADDNASGAAVLLAIARDAVRRKYKHTILFIAFGAEEAGLVGSAHYVRHPVWPLAKTTGLINFDMVGRNFFEAGANKPATVGVIGLESDPAARSAVYMAAKRVKLELVSAPAGLISLFGFSFRTDDWWFRGRIPLSVHFSTGFHEDYHKATDTPDKLVPAQMSRIARTAAGLLLHLAGAR